VPDSSHAGNGTVTAVFPSSGASVNVQYQNMTHVHALSDVSGVAATKFVSHFFNPTTHLANDAFTLTNNGAADIMGPLVLLVQVPGPLPPGFQLLAGLFGGKPLPLQLTATGVPYFSIPVTKLATGQSLTFGVQSHEGASVPLAGLTFKVFSDSAS
jgi:hypothetical protein